MRFVIRHISTRFAFILAIAAVIPLLAYGFVSLISLQRGTRESVVAGNQNVAARAAEEINRYVSSHADILKALGADLQDTNLDARQQDRIVKNFVLTFREFREITLFDEAGATVATSRVGPPRVTIPTGATITVNGALMSPIRVDEDQLPTAVFAIHLMQLNRPSGWLVGQFSLEQMWRMVDGIRIGAHGFALVVAPDGTLIAHGDPDQKSLIAQAHALTNHPLIGRGEDAPGWIEFTPADARQAPVGRGAHPEPGVDGSRRATDQRGLRQRHRAPAAADRRDRRRAAHHDRRRLAVRPPLHRADLHAEARHPGGGGRTDGGPRRHRHRRRVPGSRRVVQRHGRSAGGTAGGREAAGASGDVRPDRRRAGPRPVASDPEHRQQHAAVVAR